MSAFAVSEKYGKCAGSLVFYFYFFFTRTVPRVFSTSSMDFNTSADFFRFCGSHMPTEKARSVYCLFSLPYAPAQNLFSISYAPYISRCSLDFAFIWLQSAYVWDFPWKRISLRILSSHFPHLTKGHGVNQRCVQPDATWFPESPLKKTQREDDCLS